MTPVVAPARRFSPAVVAMLAAQATVTIAFFVLLTREGSLEAVGVPWLVPVAMFSITGIWIVVARPENRTGWLFAWFGLATGTTIVTFMAAALSEGAASAWLATIGETVNTVAVVILAPMSLLLVPDGRLLSPRWRGAVAVVGVAAIIGGAAALFVGGWGGDALQALRPSPLRPRLGDVGVLLSSIFYMLLPVAFVLGAVSIVLRFRASRGLERTRMKWLVFAAVLGVATLVVGEFAPDWLDDFLAAAGMATLPLGVTIAIA